MDRRRLRRCRPARRNGCLIDRSERSAASPGRLGGGKVRCAGQRSVGTLPAGFQCGSQSVKSSGQCSLKKAPSGFSGTGFRTRSAASCHQLAAPAAHAPRLALIDIKARGFGVRRFDECDMWGRGRAGEMYSSPRQARDRRVRSDARESDNRASRTGNVWRHCTNARRRRRNLRTRRLNRLRRRADDRRRRAIDRRQRRWRTSAS